MAPESSASAQTLKKLKGDGVYIPFGQYFLQLSHSKINETCVYYTAESKVCSSKMYILIQNLKNDSLSSNINVQQCLVKLWGVSSSNTVGCIRFCSRECAGWFLVVFFLLFILELCFNKNTNVKLSVKLCYSRVTCNYYFVSIVRIANDCKFASILPIKQVQLGSFFTHMSNIFADNLSWI